MKKENSNELVKELIEFSNTINKECAKVKALCQDTKEELSAKQNPQQNKREMMYNLRDLINANEKISDAINEIHSTIREYNKVIDDEKVRIDQLYQTVILNEDKYFQYLQKHPNAKEVIVDADTIKLLKTSIRELDLSTRVMNVLLVCDDEILYDVLVHDVADYKRCRNFGAGSLKELKDKIESLGFSLDYYLRYDDEKNQYFTLKVD